MRVTQEADYAIRMCLILDSLGDKRRFPPLDLLFFRKPGFSAYIIQARPGIVNP